MCAQEKFGVFDEDLLLYSPIPPNVSFLSPPSSILLLLFSLCSQPSTARYGGAHSRGQAVWWYSPWDLPGEGRECRTLWRDCESLAVWQPVLLYSLGSLATRSSHWRKRWWRSCTKANVSCKQYPFSPPSLPPFPLVSELLNMLHMKKLIVGRSKYVVVCHWTPSFAHWCACI